MELPEIKPPDPKVLEQNEVAFKFMRNFAEILKAKHIAYRPVTMLTEEFARIEIANVTRDNCLKQAEAAIGLVLQYMFNNNVLEFSRIAVANPEQNAKQYTMCFYGHWKTEQLEKKEV